MEILYNIGFDIKIYAISNALVLRKIALVVFCNTHNLMVQ
jgi:hypothetical protein